MGIFRGVVVRILSSGGGGAGFDSQPERCSFFQMAMPEQCEFTNMLHGDFMDYYRMVSPYHGYRSPRILHGWYSETQAQMYGVNLHYGSDGGKLAVTDLAVGRDIPWCLKSKAFDDNVFLGEIGYRVRRHSVGSCNRSLYNTLNSYPDFRSYPQYREHASLPIKSLTQMSKIGWYSKKQNEAMGACLYETLEGKEAMVTEITIALSEKPKWDDAEPVGRMGKFICRVGYGSGLRCPDRDCGYYYRCFH